jgi:hypothetical protein
MGRAIMATGFFELRKISVAVLVPLLLADALSFYLYPDGLRRTQAQVLTPAGIFVFGTGSRGAALLRFPANPSVSWRVDSVQIGDVIGPLAEDYVRGSIFGIGVSCPAGSWSGSWALSISMELLLTVLAAPAVIYVSCRGYRSLQQQRYRRRDSLRGFAVEPIDARRHMVSGDDK